MVQTIELDCAPGYPRPGDLIDDVVKGTPLEGKTGDTVSRLFGCWKWDLSGVSSDDWEAARPVIRQRIERLYKAGKIRYGSW